MLDDFIAAPWFVQKIYSVPVVVEESTRIRETFSGDVFVNGSDITITLADPTGRDLGLPVVRGQYIRVFNIGSANVTVAVTGSAATWTVKPGTCSTFICHHDEWVLVVTDAINVKYDNAASGLTATTAQGAIDELQAIKATYYRHVQSAAATVWTVNHNLGKLICNVTAKDSSGSEIYGQVDFVDVNTLTITFSAATGGEAYVA
jgi:hypothetical protein